MKLYELIVEDWDVDGVNALSLVSDPAIEVMGTYFNKDQVMFKEIEEQGLFVSPILIPEKRILRVDASGAPYEVFLSKKTVKDLAHMYLKNKFQDSVTIEHEDKVENVTLVESWVTDSFSKDKSKDYGINVPAGSWMGVFSIDNEEIREKFRNGEIGAISIEGIFAHLQRKESEANQLGVLMEKNVLDLTEEESEIVLNQIREELKNQKTPKEELSYVDTLGEEEAKDLLNQIHSMLMPQVEMEQPSVASSYPGEVASGSISPATL